jgi:hypothetical protein
VAQVPGPAVRQVAAFDLFDLATTPGTPRTGELNGDRLATSWSHKPSTPQQRRNS